MTTLIELFEDLQKLIIDKTDVATRALLSKTSKKFHGLAAKCSKDKVPYKLDIKPFIASGNLEVVKYLAQMPHHIWKASYCSTAADAGQLEVLKWLRSNNCPWDKETCNRAVTGGYLEVLQWVRQEGCPWDGTTSLRAAACGRLEIFKWVIQEGCPWTKDAFSVAAGCGHCPIIEFAVQNNYELDLLGCLRGATKWGYLTVLEYLNQSHSWVTNISREVAEELCFSAILGGYENIILWFKTNSLAWNAETRALAVKRWPNTFLLSN